MESTRDDLLRRYRETRDLSVDLCRPLRPEDYRVLLFGLLGEIFPETGDAHNISLGASVTNLALTQEPPRRIPGR